ncbi:MAG: tRNA-guanine transglycosylase DpdA, partial [Calothrix sp. MO_167.B42]|nr:tRNA-guanine transglycosylase DpdA [Calothrix sp. MO_167.B42]
MMGDCGAFGYIKQEEPPYNTVEILDYYEKLGFNYGVSIDHLIVGQFAQSGVREKRYNLTLRNAEEFISKHQNIGYNFTPIGVAQGWNPQKYAEAVKALVEMGYEYIAIGGVARTPTKEILEILQEVSQHLTPTTKLHLFGVGRIDALPYFRHLGVTSFDSASPLRKAWFDAKENYHTLD